MVLGSATPSLEIVAARDRRALPEARPAAARRSAGAQCRWCAFAANRLARAQDGIGEALRTALAARLARGEQSLVFVNRRGFAPSLLCARLRVGSGLPALQRQAHHASHAGGIALPSLRPRRSDLPKACPACGNVDLLPLGCGTQRLERVLADAFPAARIARIDRDTHAGACVRFAAMRGQMAANELDILIGTQMLGQGPRLPAPHAGGRAGRRQCACTARIFVPPSGSRALLMQVAGRAGRAGLEGEVIVQTDFPEHPVYAAIGAHDYERLAAGAACGAEDRAAAAVHARVAVLAAEAHHRDDVDVFLRAAHAAARGAGRARRERRDLPRRFPRCLRAARDSNAGRWSCKARAGRRCSSFCRRGGPRSPRCPAAAFAGRSTSIRRALPDADPKPARTVIIYGFVPIGADLRTIHESAVNDLKQNLELAMKMRSAASCLTAPTRPSSVDRPKQAAHGDYASNVALALAKQREAQSARAWRQALVAATAGVADSSIAPRSRAPDSSIIFVTAGRAAGDRRAGAGRTRRLRPVAARTRGRARHGGVRFGESDRAAACRPRPAGGAGRCDRVPCSSRRATRSPASSTTTTPGQQIENLAVSVRARAQEILGESDRVPGGRLPRRIHPRARAALSRRKSATTCRDIESIRRFAVARAAPRAGPRPAWRSGVQLRPLLPRKLALHRRPRRRDRRAPRSTSGKTYEQDGALWLQTTDYGDDKDRVMRKSDGGYTYFVPDVAYHVTKWERGFRKVINVQGGDHHSTVTRVRAGLQAVGMGIPQGYPDYVMHKMVTVMRGGEEVKISKRAGDYVTLREPDRRGRARRRALLPRVAQGGHRVRVRHRPRALADGGESRVLRAVRARARLLGAAAGGASRLPRRHGALARRRPVAADQSLRGGAAAAARRLSGGTRDAARDAAPHQVTFYLKDLAQEFHSYYNAERFLVDDARTAARATGAWSWPPGQSAVRNGLAVLGISAPPEYKCNAVGQL